MSSSNFQIMKIQSRLAGKSSISVFILALLLPGFLLSFSGTQDELPLLNRKVLEYVESVMGEQVHRGECWDLANQALLRIDAKWDGRYKYGEEYNPKKTAVLPGDFIQFSNVRVRYREGNTIYTETMAQHTAIVYRVLDGGVLELAHQNTSFSGRTVGVSKLDLTTVVSGKMWFYRPVR
jgi:hypothetical protein